MLNIFVLNVGHGDSAVVEYRSGEERAFGVIDSNRPRGGKPKALTKLHELGVEELSFVCLTHPHKDHYDGLYDILHAYVDRIDHFFTFPIGDLINNTGRLKKLAAKYVKLRDSQDDAEVRRGLLEFLKILQFATTNFACANWTECAGEDSRIAPKGFQDIVIKTILPPRKVRGYILQQIESGEAGIAENLRDNDLSIALQLEYRGQKIILGGDGTFDNWLDHRRWDQRAQTTLKTNVVKLPHHGSRVDCAPIILRDLFRDNGDRFAVISANGQSHPDREVLEWLESNGVSPYCTNLVPQCGANVATLLQLPDLDPVLARWIREISDTDAVQPCQGDVKITIDDLGAVTVVPEFDHPCGYRNDYHQLFGI